MTWSPNDKSIGGNGKESLQGDQEHSESGMESLDTFVPQVQGLSSTKHELERLCHILNKSEDILCKQTARLTTVLAALDPAIHSLGYLYAL